MVRLISLLLAAWLPQGSPGSEVAPYVREGDRVEQRFRGLREDLDQFLFELRTVVASVAPELLPEVDREDRAPEPGVHGYQLLPAIVDEEPPERRERITTFSYSWPATSGYIDTEAVKLERTRQALDEVRERPEGEAATITGRRRVELALRDVIAEYRTLVDNLGTIDQYLQYNRFWQRTIAENRERFDGLTRLYDLAVGETSVAGSAIRAFLGQPSVPEFVDFEVGDDGRIFLRLPVYTDIEDVEFLETVERGVESMWTVADAGTRYALDIEIRRLSPSVLYRSEGPPNPGDHIDLSRHTGQFPDDGAVLTTGAESTYGYIGDYVALGAGDITVRTLAHEFGHVMGFADGYLRGYRDRGAQGFEILELTSAFDDIMSAPREGRVLPSHFELLMDGAER
jgi:hypothetical protein